MLGDSVLPMVINDQVAETTKQLSTIGKNSNPNSAKQAAGVTFP